MEIEIEKGVAVAVSRRGGRWLTLISKMEVGDSVVLTSQNEAASMHDAFVRANLPVTKRTIADGQIRVWRVAEWPARHFRNDGNQQTISLDEKQS
jgi:hypothetical protein